MKVSAAAGDSTKNIYKRSPFPSRHCSKFCAYLAVVPSHLQHLLMRREALFFSSVVWSARRIEPSRHAWDRLWLWILFFYFCLSSSVSLNILTSVPRLITQREAAAISLYYMLARQYAFGCVFSHPTPPPPLFQPYLPLRLCVWSYHCRTTSREIGTRLCQESGQRMRDHFAAIRCNEGRWVWMCSGAAYAGLYGRCWWQKKMNTGGR